MVEGVATRNDFNQVFAGRLRNVIARIPGTDSTGGVLLLSHFDSVPTSMNANDGGLRRGHRAGDRAGPPGRSATGQRRRAVVR